MPLYTVRYYAGPYSGNRTVKADDEEDAIAIVKGEIRGQMTIPNNTTRSQSCPYKRSPQPLLCSYWERTRTALIRY